MIPGNINTALISGAEGGGYQVQRSLRFNSSDSAFCGRSFTSAGNRRTWTWAGWVKRSAVGSGDQMLFSTGVGGATTSAVIFFRNDLLCYSTLAGDVLATTAVFRDPSAWYHILVSFDSTQASAALRLRFYVNGSEITQFSTDARSAQISQNTDYGFNLSQAHEIGRFAADSSRYFSGYLADIHFIDGQALTPSSFTEVSAITGQLIPKAYTGTFTGNSFWLKFADNSAATATTLGKDSSGLGNNWTPNNLSVTAGAGNDSLTDTPTSYGTDTGAGGEVRGNYATLNPLATSSAAGALSNGNLDFVSGSGNGTSPGTIAVSSGKWYWEVAPDSNNMNVGIVSTSSSLSADLGGTASGYAYYGFNGSKVNSNSQSSYGASWGSGDIIGVALDLDAGTLVFYKNGSSQGTAFSGLTGSFYPAVSDYTGSSGFALSCNFGQRPFAYTAPSGYKCLADTSLPAPVVAKPSTVMDVKLYTGNGGTQTITTGFSPDFVWVKSRSEANTHNLYDIIRGTGKELVSNTTAAEATYANSLTAFNSTGFDVGNASWMNGSAKTYVAWCFDAGTTTTTNTVGSITSSLRASPSSGFSVVSYTGTGSAATVGHGLGVAPSMLIVKKRSSAGSWEVYFRDLGASYYLELERTNGRGGPYSGLWNDTAPTSTVFSIGNDGGVNTNGSTYVCYAWAPVAGYSSAFSYSGNGSSDGPMVWLGFRPRFIIQKRTDSAGSWLLIDTARDPVNVARNEMFANSSAAEYDNGSLLDVLSNGFKIRATFANMNASGGSYIGFAFAESPFQYARAR